MPNLRAVDQLAIDERVVQDGELESALEQRLRAGDDVSEARKVFKAADATVKDRVATLALTDGDALRCGRFRFTKTAIAAKSVSFETDASSRLRIELWAKD